MEMTWGVIAPSLKSSACAGKRRWHTGNSLLVAFNGTVLTSGQSKPERIRKFVPGEHMEPVQSPAGPASELILKLDQKMGLDSS